MFEETLGVICWTRPRKAEAYQYTGWFKLPDDAPDFIRNLWREGRLKSYGPTYGETDFWLRVEGIAPRVEPGDWIVEWERPSTVNFGLSVFTSVEFDYFFMGEDEKIIGDRLIKSDPK